METTAVAATTTPRPPPQAAEGDGRPRAGVEDQSGDVPRGALVPVPESAVAPALLRRRSPEALDKEENNILLRGYLMKTLQNFAYVS